MDRGKSSEYARNGKLLAMLEGEKMGLFYVQSVVETGLAGKA